MKRVLEKDNWKTALQNQKGVYLLTDKSNGKMYVGSAYGENMILGRWIAYIATGHGGNVELRKLTCAIARVLTRGLSSRVINSRYHEYETTPACWGGFVIRL